MKKLFLFVMIILPTILSAQTVSGLKVETASGSASTVTFDVEWTAATLPTPWLDSMWVFVDYNKNGKMERLLISGGTLTEHTATKAGTGEFIPENDMGAWVYGDARTSAAGSFSAKVELYTKEPDIIIAGACAYASSYPPVGDWLSDSKLGFTGTPMYDITLTDGSTTVTVEAGNTFLLPCSYTVSSFTDRTGAPGIINCKAPTGLALTASPEAICEGQSTTLTASATDAAQYRIDNGAWQTEMDFNVSPVANASYTLYAKTAEGCVASLANAALVTVNPMPEDLTLTANPGTICAGASSTLTASATNGTSYSIDNIAWQLEADFNETPSVNSSYLLYVRTAAGCSATKANAATVTVNPIPDVPTMGGGGTYCNSVNITAAFGSGGTGIRWDDGSTVTPRSVGAGTYYAITTSDEGCESGPATVSVIIGTPGANGQAPDATCGCAVGLINCAGTCRPTCCTGNVSVTACSGFTQVSAAAVQGCTEVNWNDAKSICQAMGSGWRLPDFGEALCIKETLCSIPGINCSTFIWTSSECSTIYGNSHYLVNTGGGYQQYACSGGDQYEEGVKCVK
jgi:hypothetical protein